METRKNKQTNCKFTTSVSEFSDGNLLQTYQITRNISEGKKEPKDRSYLVILFIFMIFYFFCIVLCLCRKMAIYFFNRRNILFRNFLLQNEISSITNEYFPDNIPIHFLFINSCVIDNDNALAIFPIGVDVYHIFEDSILISNHKLKNIKFYRKLYFKTMLEYRKEKKWFGWISEKFVQQNKKKNGNIMPNDIDSYADLINLESAFTRKWLFNNNFIIRKALKLKRTTSCTLRITIELLEFITNPSFFDPLNEIFMFCLLNSMSISIFVYKFENDRLHIEDSKYFMFEDYCAFQVVAYLLEVISKKSGPHGIQKMIKKIDNSNNKIKIFRNDHIVDIEI